MHRGKIPKSTGTHRIAAIALYEALISQCAKLPLPHADREALSNIVRNRFRHLRPQRLGLKKALYAGYTAIDILDGAVVGDRNSLERVQDILQRTPVDLKEPPKPKINLKQIEWEKRREEAKAPPEEYKLINMFPRKTVEGQRRVPTLANANGFPFLRWKKPQPASVTRILRILIRQRQRRLDTLRRVAAFDVPLAEREDEWEELVTMECGWEPEDESYGETARDLLHHLDVQFNEMGRKRKEWIEKMDAIVVEEQRLKDLEDAERKRVKDAGSASTEVQKSWIERIVGSIMPWKG